MSGLFASFLCSLSENPGSAQRIPFSLLRRPGSKAQGPWFVSTRTLVAWNEVTGAWLNEGGQDEKGDNGLPTKKNPNQSNNNKKPKPKPYPVPGQPGVSFPPLEGYCGLALCCLYWNPVGTARAGEAALSLSLSLLDTFRILQRYSSL